jgi:hypothetical protein
MKRFTVFTSLILLIAILSFCSSKPALELTNVSASIVNDKTKTGSINITQGDKKGKELVPTALYYEFTITNVGKKRFVGINDAGEFKIIPSDNLKAMTEEIVGFNIFDFSSYMGTGLGHSISYIQLLEPGEEREFSFAYGLGVNEKNPDVPIMAPPEEKLKELEENALDAELVVTVKDAEIARFELSNK